VLHDKYVNLNIINQNGRRELENKDVKVVCISGMIYRNFNQCSAQILEIIQNTG
jgi:hypothetical protein